MKSRRLIVAPDDYNKRMVSTCTGALEGVDVRLGSKADMWGAPTHVRFTPESDGKCDICSVRYGPIAALIGFSPRNSAPQRRLDCGDVDLSHAHHSFKRALCFVAPGRQRFDQYTRRNLPRHTPLVFAPAARTFLAAIIDDGVPIAIRLSLIVNGDLERKGFIMFERRTAVKADTGDTSNFELDRQHISLLARWIVTGCTVDGTHCAVDKGFGIKSSSSLGILIVPEANCVLCHCMSFRSEARLHSF